MKPAIGPGVLCYIVPPTSDGYEQIVNKLCTVVEPLIDGSVFGCNRLYARPGQRAWVVELSAPVTVCMGQNLRRLPIYESWLRPISGPDIDIAESGAEPQRDTTLTPRKQLEHVR